MKHLAAGLLLFCWLPLWGQVTNLHFTNLSIDAGLSDKMVFAVAQDSTGLMWFGTAEGLNRYDGYPCGDRSRTSISPTSRSTRDCRTKWFSPWHRTVRG